MTTPTISAHGTEILDDPAADPAVVRRMLGDIARANHWFGGTATVRRGLGALLEPADRGGQLTLLDVGTGAGDVARAARRWAGRRGVTLVVVGIERHRAAARLATDHGVPTVVACGTHLPVRHAANSERRMANGERSPFADIVLMSQLLHHFDDEGAVALLASATRAARRGVIVADLRPSRVAGLAFRAAGRAMGFHPATLADGVTSLARGRDAAALARLARRAGAVPVLARDLPMARVVMACRVGT